MDQNHLFANPGQIQGICRCGVAAANHHHGFVPVEHAVAVGAVAQSSADELLFLRHSQGSGVGTGGDDHRPAFIIPFLGVDCLDTALQLQPRHLGVPGLHSEPGGTLLHLLTQGKAVHALREAGVVVNLGGEGHLSSRCHFFQHQNRQACPSSIQSGCIPAGAAADNQHIINHGIITPFPHSITEKNSSLCDKITFFPG